MLSWIFKKLIELYWRNIPESKRRVCIYKTSCSKAVYSTINNKGFWIAIQFYLSRRSNCKDGYSFFFKEGKVHIKTRLGQILQEEEINPLLVSEFKMGK